MTRQNRTGYKYEYRIAIMGSSKVGKTAFIEKLITRDFPQTYRATLEDRRVHVVQHNERTYVCLLIDTSGSHDFPAMHRLTISESNGFLIVYSIDSATTWKRARSLVEEIREQKSDEQDVRIIIVGNRFSEFSLEEINLAEEIEEYIYTLRTEWNVKITHLQVSFRNDDVSCIFLKLLDMYGVSPDKPRRKTSVSQKRSRSKSVPIRYTEDEIYENKSAIAGSDSILGLPDFELNSAPEKPLTRNGSFTDLTQLSISNNTTISVLTSNHKAVSRSTEYDETKKPFRNDTLFPLEVDQKSFYDTPPTVVDDDYDNDVFRSSPLPHSNRNQFTKSPVSFDIKSLDKDYSPKIDWRRQHDNRALHWGRNDSSLHRSKGHSPHQLLPPGQMLSCSSPESGIFEIDDDDFDSPPTPHDRSPSVLTLADFQGSGDVPSNFPMRSSTPIRIPSGRNFKPLSENIYSHSL